MDAELQILLERPAWVRALAYEIARDAEAAEDLVQDTWVAALRRPPRPGVPVRRWFARVMRNSARDGGRRDRVRRDREAARAEPEPPVAPDELLERLEVQRRVVEAVRALDEPYRSTVLLRWFEELEPREIARRTDTPVRTVHSRLHRGLGLLRERLAPEDERERPKWIAALVAFAGREDAAATTGTMVMSTKLLLAGAGAVAAGAIAWVAIPRSAGGAAPPTAEPPAAAGPVAVVEPAVAAVDDDDAGRALAAAADPPPVGWPSEAFLEASSDEPGPITGRVIDLDGAPVAGVPIAASPFGREPTERTTSDAEGRFALANPPRSCTIDAERPWATVLQPRLLDHTPRSTAVLVVARAIDLAGAVRDPDGLAVEGAAVAVAAPHDLRATFQEVLDESHTREWTAVTDASGAFAIDGAPAVPGAELVASRLGYRDARVPLTASDDVAIELVLEPEGEPIARLDGLVVSADGEPVPGAYVALGGGCAVAREDGTFRLALERPDGARTLSAQAPGWLPTRLEARPGAPLAEAFPDPVVLVLEQHPRTLAGRVVDDAGRPAAGVEVWTSDTREFGTVQPFDDMPEYRHPVSVEALARGEVPFGGEPLTTDGAGRFELGGLEDRAYTVLAFDRGLFRFAQSEAVRPGDEVTVRLPAGGGTHRVTGRLRSLGGAPIAGAEVSFGATFDAVRLADGGSATEEHFTESVVTDAEGRFTADAVPGLARRIHVDGGGIAWTEDESFDPSAGPVDLRLPVLCHVRVETTDSGAQWVELLDADGARLPLRAKHGWIESATHRRELVDGVSEVLRVSEAARTLVVGGGDGERARLPVELAPGAIHVLRP